MKKIFCHIANYVYFCNLFYNKVMKKKYIAPGMAVVSFRNERGYASSGVMAPLEEQINLMISMEEEQEHYHNSIQDFTLHNDWVSTNDTSFWR